MGSVNAGHLFLYLPESGQVANLKLKSFNLIPRLYADITYEVTEASLNVLSYEPYFKDAVSCFEVNNGLQGNLSVKMRKGLRRTVHVRSRCSSVPSFTNGTALRL